MQSLTLATSKPALLIVHGAYFVPETWTPFVKNAESRSFQVRCPHLPTCGDSPPKATIQDDVNVVRNAIRDLKRAGHPIIVLAHSFGGIVASQSVTEEHYAAKPCNYQTAGVVRLVYLCAHMPLQGQSLGDIFAKHGVLSDVELDIRADGSAIPKNASATFYNDMSASSREHYTARNVTHNLGLVGDAKVTHVPWKDIPSTYVYTTQDLAVKKQLQEAMVKDAIDEGGKIDTAMLDTAHCPFLSSPEEVTSIIEDVWKTCL